MHSLRFFRTDLNFNLLLFGRLNTIYWSSRRTPPTPEALMQITIQTRQFALTEAIRDHVETHLRGALGRFRNRLAAIEVRLSDLNGPRGGIDKRCHLNLRVGGLPAIVVEDTSDDLYAAITRSVSRARQTLTRRLRRARALSAPRQALPHSITG